MQERVLNIDIPGSIRAFESALHYLEFKTKIYRLLFRGKGLEFEQFRSFAPDDDASLIDWKASMRSQQLLVRQYKEEKDQKILFIIDVSDNMVFGSEKKLKCEYAAEVAAAFVHLIISYGDKVGFLFFNERVVNYAMPLGSMRQFYFFVNELSKPEIYGGASRLSKAVRFVTDYFISLSSVVLISDFMHPDSDFDLALRYLSHKFETIALMIKDPRDLVLPNVSGEYLIQDPLTGEQILVNPKVARQQYEQHSLRQEESVMALFRANRVDSLRFLTSEPFAFPLAHFLKERIIYR